MITITAAIVLAVKSIPAGIPFEVGIPEATMTTLYIAFNVAPEVALPQQSCQDSLRSG
jgi:hypothetical protein